MTEYSYNGWKASKDPKDFGGLAPLVVFGESFAPGVRAGDVHTILEYVAKALHVRVEPVIAPGWHNADDWGYAYRPNRNNPNSLSCHASGTAIDYNATRHPNKKVNTFSVPQRAEIRRILVEVEGTVRWGGDFAGTKDEMHFEICKNASEVARVAARIRARVSTPASGQLMRQGSSGDAVSSLQAFMNRAFPSYSRLAVDGSYGPATVAAIKEFQRRSGLDQDGVVGPATKAALARLGWK